MELGIDMFGDLHFNKNGEIQSAGERLHELIEEIKLMDEVSLDFFGIGEHHRPDYVVSTPEIILAAAATVTKNIKLGSAVSVLSSSDPVKLYQSFATVDLLSNGRAEIWAGRGSFVESFPLFGFDLNNYDKFNETLQHFEKFSRSDNANMNPNAQIQTFVYLHIAKINKHFLEGTFTKGLELVPEIEEKLHEYHLQLDRHRILVFYYKIACLYFGSGDNERAIDYLNRIVDLYTETVRGLLSAVT